LSLSSANCSKEVRCFCSTLSC
jgi:hypothetical protein